jgi:hypothetical protein
MTFSRERVISPPGTGVCGCCGLKAYSDQSGKTYVLYRAAGQGMNRDEILLGSTDGAEDFQTIYSHPWPLTACPMSSAFLGAGSAGTLAAWETKGQVYLTAVSSPAFSQATLLSPPGEGRRKHPVASRNAAGDTLLVWVEGSGWNQGGALAWQVFDEHGQATADQGRGDELPVWSFAACYARADGTFVVLR